MGQPTLHMESWYKNLQNLDLMYLGDAIDDLPRTWAFLQISNGVDIFWIDEILKNSNYFTWIFVKIWR